MFSYQQNTISNNVIRGMLLELYGVGDLIMIYNDYMMTSESLYFLYFNRNSMPIGIRSMINKFKTTRISNEI